jgi:hypothetical protein
LILASSGFATSVALTGADDDFGVGVGVGFEGISDGVEEVDLEFGRGFEGDSNDCAGDELSDLGAD